MRVPKHFAWLLLIASASLSAQVLNSSKGPSVVVLPTPIETIPRGSPGEVQLHFRVNPGYHINSNTPKSEFLIPTTLKLDAPTDIVIGRVTYPAGKDMAFPFSPDEKLSVYSGEFPVSIVVRPLHSVLPAKYMIRGQLKYQACDNAQCYPPKQLPVEFEVKVGKATTSAKKGNPAQSPHVHR